MGCPPRSRTVAVAIRLSLASGRAIARGVIRQAKRRRWKLRLIDVAENGYAETMAEFVRSNAGGVIVSELTDAVVRVLSDSAVATVVIGRSDLRLAARQAKTLFVRNDDEGIGLSGARHLMSFGRFRSYGFITGDHPKSYCASAREAGFLRALAAAPDPVQILSVEDADDGATARDKLCRELERLKKPAAVMAATDTLAILALEAAQQAKIRVPDRLAVIGVDNDELLCELADPSLTSIEPDHEAEGELAARTLAALMRHARPPAEDSLVNKRHRIVERESAHPIAPAVHLVRAAQDFIAANFTKGIGVREVVAHLRVSRRLADLRYRELANESIYQTIMRLRLDKARTLLASTSQTIAKVIERCGFPNANCAARTFKRHFGVTMGHYRKNRRCLLSTNLHEFTRIGSCS